MRFKHYLIEQDDTEQQYQQAAQTLLNDCQPFFKELNYDVNSAITMYRGVKKFPTDTQLLHKKDVRENRKPTDTPRAIQQYIDQQLKEEFGVAFRSNAMYTSGARMVAANYGTLAVTFPIGNFKYIWSPEVEDLFARIRDRAHEQSADGKWEGYLQQATAHYQQHGELPYEIEEMLDDILDEAHYQSTNLKQAIRSGHEIMVATDQYYMVRFGERVGIHRALQQQLEQS